MKGYETNKLKRVENICLNDKKKNSRIRASTKNFIAAYLRLSLYCERKQTINKYIISITKCNSYNNKYDKNLNIRPIVEISQNKKKFFVGILPFPSMEFSRKAYKMEWDRVGGKTLQCTESEPVAKADNLMP